VPENAAKPRNKTSFGEIADQRVDAPIFSNFDFFQGLVTFSGRLQALGKQQRLRATQKFEPNTM